MPPRHKGYRYIRVGTLKSLISATESVAHGLDRITSGNVSHNKANARFALNSVVRILTTTLANRK